MFSTIGSRRVICVAPWETTAVDGTAFVCFVHDVTVGERERTCAVADRATRRRHIAVAFGCRRRQRGGHSGSDGRTRRGGRLSWYSATVEFDTVAPAAVDGKTPGYLVIHWGAVIFFVPDSLIEERELTEGFDPCCSTYCGYITLAWRWGSANMLCKVYHLRCIVNVL